METKKEKQQEKEKQVSSNQDLKKKVNKSWEAFGRLKGAFIINDPKFLL